MPKRVLLLLAGVAFILTAGAGLLLWRHAYQGVTVLRLRHAVPALTPLAAADVEVVTIPRSAAPEGRLQTPAELAGRYAATALPKGDTLLQAHLREKPPNSPLQAPLGPQERLISIPVDPTRTLAGDLRPGDRVTVLAVAPRRDPKSPPPAPELLMDHTLLVGLRSKSGAPAGHTADPPVTNPTTDTLSAKTDGLLPGSEPGAAVLRVTIDQAARLAAAVQDGQTIYLLLAQREESP